MGQPRRADGYQAKVNLRRAFACAPGIVNPVANHEQFLELIFALGGPGFQRSYDRFRADPGGRRLLEERPDLVATLTDTARLLRCPNGSLGHAYLDFMSTNRLDAGLYDNTHHDLPAIADRLGWDDEFYFVVHRGIALHDLLHVLGGYGPDVGGELGVLGFTHGQVDGWATGASIAMLLALRMEVPRRARRRFWREAVDRGRGAGVLFAGAYEEWIDDPIDEVRDRLAIKPAESAHPHGLIYSSYQFGRKARRGMDGAFERYEYDPDRDLVGTGVDESR